MFDELVKTGRIRPYYQQPYINSQLGPILRPIPVEHVRTGLGHAVSKSAHVQAPASIQPSNAEKPAVGAWSSQGPASVRPASISHPIPSGRILFC